MDFDMTRIKAMLVSPEWWVTIIFAALAISILGAYMKQWLDRAMLTSSKSWREYRKWQKAEREHRVERASQDLHAFSSMVAREMRVRFRLVTYLVLAVGTYMLAIALAFGGLGKNLDWFERVVNALLLLWLLESWTLRSVRSEIREAEQRHR